MSSAKATSPLESAVHSLTLIYRIAGEESPTNHSLVKDVWAGPERLLAHQKTNKEPISVLQLELLVSSEAAVSATLYDIRSVALSLLAFAAFLRFDELSRLIRSDVKFENEMLQLFIESSKTDQFRDRAWVLRQWWTDI